MKQVISVLMASGAARVAGKDGKGGEMRHWVGKEDAGFLEVQHSNVIVRPRGSFPEGCDLTHITDKYPDPRKETYHQGISCHSAGSLCFADTQWCAPEGCQWCSDTPAPKEGESMKMCNWGCNHKRKNGCPTPGADAWHCTERAESKARR
ncbi:unnamed protein product [Amoebophrya sp. A120]|nr:unnamed protein product [Amoebophrya sp. A120]|eukprot:GSA120T00017006001.1